MAEEMAVAEGLGPKRERNPDMDLAQKLFMLTNKCDSVGLVEIRKAVMDKIKQQSAFVCVLSFLMLAVHVLFV